MRESKRDPNTPEWIIEIVERYMRSVQLTSRRSRYRSTFISLANEISMEASQRAAQLPTAATALYLAGRWSAPNVSDSDAENLWTALRDALGLPEGTATKLGV